uniref:Protein kinase domain-containing protein n=1 Tax=Mycena chlorophos TaxID=658473 RepID=A0ABQ0LQN2_MYCCL|nr:predicted protein [Mycena chlorophos]
MSSKTSPLITVSFEDFGTSLPRSLTAKRWRVPGADPTRFCPIPPTSRNLRVSRNCLFGSSFADNRRQVVPLSDVRGWGLQDMARIYYARAVADDGTRFCLRFIFNATVATEDRHSDNARHYVRLIKDAQIHARHLQSTAGLITPMHYGMWIAETKDWAGTVLMSITQWCGLSWKSLVGTKMDTQENRLLVARTFEMLHDVGVQLDGKVATSGSLRHVLIDVDNPVVPCESLLRGGALCYIAGFGDGLAKHDCKRRLPILPIGARPDCGCKELESVRYLLGFRQESDTTTAEAAVKFHAEYSARHTQYPNSSVLLAQRKRFFHDSPAVFTGITVSFDGEGDDAPLKLVDAEGKDVDPETPMSSYPRSELVPLALGRVVWSATNAGRAKRSAPSSTASKASV